ncbi:hypothetical protein DRH14_01950 [Candidatus Shapirobacteria bacterium]|nr:MAG: hypothetical protein DRH14_01950 [Candidatus Shapirobacteria bacterium]
MISSTLNMLKELFLAILIGGILGFTVTGGIWNFKHKKSSPKPTTPTPTISLDNSNTSPSPNPTGQTTTKASNFLDINQPQDQTIIDQDTIKIKGQTTPLSQVVILVNNQSFFIEANQQGNFSQKIELEGGANLIQISSIDPNDNQIDKEILITYSTAKI